MAGEQRVPPISASNSSCMQVVDKLAGGGGDTLNKEQHCLWWLCMHAGLLNEAILTQVC